MSKQTIKPDEPCEAYTEMAENWAVVDALHSGTLGMRKLAQKYLPQEPRESTDAYSARLERAILFPGLKRALKNFVGKAFSNSITFKSPLNAQWEEWTRNIDLAGTPIQTFCESVFLSGLKYGHTTVLADYPVMPERATLFDERQILRARPYLVLRGAKDVIGWRTKVENNNQILSRVRIQETFTEYEDLWDDDGETYQIRVLEPGVWEVWRQAEDTWYLHDTGQSQIKDKIPLVPIYFDQHNGQVLKSTVPMGDLAWSNIAHWQSYSDQRNILRIARVPIIFVTGATTEDLGGSLDIGPQRFIALNNPNADMKFIEHSGAAIEAGRTDCQDLEDRMMLMAAEAMMGRPGSETATGRAIDSRDATSPLAVWVQSFEYSFNEALKLMAEYAQMDSAPEIQMSRDFGIIGNTSDIDALYNARVAGEISREAYLSELKRRGVLSETYDASADQDILLTELPRGTNIYKLDPGELSQLQVEQQQDTPEPQDAKDQQDAKN